MFGWRHVEVPWKLTDAVAPAASAQAAPTESAFVECAADGSISLSQLKAKYGMELGSTVTLKTSNPGQTNTPKTALVYHIAKIEGPTVSLVGTDENKSETTTTV